MLEREVAWNIPVPYAPSPQSLIIVKKLETFGGGHTTSIACIFGHCHWKSSLSIQILLLSSLERDVGRLDGQGYENTDLERCIVGK